MIGHGLRSWIRTRVLAVAAGATIGALAASLCFAADTTNHKGAKPADKPAGSPPPAAPKPPERQAPPPAAPIPPGPITPAHVQAAVERAQKWFLAHRNKDGNWEEVQRPEHPKEGNGITDLRSHQWGGLSSLATYALLASGVDHRTPEMQRATEFLLHANITSTYGLGLSSQIVDYLPEKDTSELVKRNVIMLLAGMYQPPSATIHQPGNWRKDVGFYGYWVGTDEISTKATFPKEINPKTIGTSQPKGHYDRSNSQYGVLGMWALAEAGGEVPTLYWQIEDAAWRRAQLRDGGWNYTDGGEDGGKATPSMTAAGIATLFITQDYTLDQDWGECRGAAKNENIERGLAWMDRHINDAISSSFYTMYGVERIGTASGRKYFGTADWYKIGAERLVRSQQKDGSWDGDHGQIPSTAFALVFLSRGRAPVLMNKLEYGTVKPGDKTPEPWDERPRDIANLAKWVGHENETYLNWQVVNLKVNPEDLHDAPILYISGNKALEFTKEEEDKLRAFVQQGGMILGNDDCGKGVFTKSFEALGKKLFPKYEWQQTPQTDFFYNEQFKKWRGAKPLVRELSNGVRKLMAVIPVADPSRAWQAKAATTKEELFGLAGNIFLYAVDKKNMLTKGDTYIVKADPKVPTFKSLGVARLDVGGNCDPEPGGWPRMIGVMRNSHNCDVKVDTIKPEALAGNAYKVADLTGTGKFTLSAAARSAIKQFVEGGGTLIVDAAGGDVNFAESAQNELAATFGESNKLELLPPEHPVYNEPGDRIEHVGWRQFAIDKVADKRHAKLRGITFGKRTGVFLSREDISGGIVGEPVDGIYGYDPATATDLMAAMLIYAENGGAAPPASQPAHPVAGKDEEARVEK